MERTVSGDVAGAACSCTVSVKSASFDQLTIVLRDHGGNGYSLHGISHDRILAHAQIIIRAPDIHLILGICSMRHRELGSKTVDVVEVAV